SRSFSLTISGTGGPRLSVTTTALATRTVGQNYSQTLNATGGGPPYQWGVGQGFPAGLPVDVNTGVISGIPTASGAFSFPVQVTDSTRATALGTVTLSINPAPLTITTVAPIFNGTVGVAYVQTFKASGGAQPYTWSIISGSAGE